MPDIFVNFRKPDRSLERDRLYRALVARYGPDRIFKSGVSIPAGTDYAAVLMEQARTCKIMVVLIGPDWMTVDEYGYCPSYWDQMEIATALQAGNTVIPVLLGNSAMLPHPDQLPVQIAQLGRLQFQRLSETSFDQDTERLLHQLATMLPPSDTEQAPQADPQPSPVTPPAPSVAMATGPGWAQSGQGNIQAHGDVATISGSHAGRDLIGIQKKKFKLLGAEVPATALVIGLLGLGAAATGTTIAAIEGGGSASSMGGGSVSSSDICGHAKQLRAYTADMGTEAYQEHLNDWHALLDETKKASDPKLASYAKTVDATDRNSDDYYQQVTNIIDLSCSY